MKPLVSILIPLYNHEEFVEETLDSILNDSYENKEIIIINDGSTDRSDEVVKSWIEKNGSLVDIRYKSRENIGLTKTLNELLSLSKGEFLVALASDDYLIDGGIEKRVEYLLNHPSKKAVFGDCIVVKDGEVISESGLFSYRYSNKKNFFSDQGIRREFLTNFSMPGPVLMVRRDFYTEFDGYNEDMYMEDYDLYLRLATLGLIGFLDERVSGYRIHDGSMSAGDSKKYIKLLEDSIKTLLLHKSKFHGIERGLLYLQVFKFYIRIFAKKISSYL